MDFNLFYSTTRTSHGRTLSRVIKARNAVEAFKQSTKIMKDSNMMPDDFSSFYVAPVKVNWRKSYNSQRHGWDRDGNFPR